MEKLYIIDPTNFDGHVVNTILSNGNVDYMPTPTTFEEYKQHKNNPNLIALEWDEFYNNYYSPHLKAQCTPFKRCTKQQFYDALECLPPKRWTRQGNNEFFFLGECYTADLYYCYVRKHTSYYTALRSITTNENDIFNLNKIE